MGPQYGPVCCGENMITTSEGLLHGEFVLWKQQTVFCKYLGKSSLGQILAKINITHSASLFSWTCLTKASTTAVFLCQMYLYLKPLLQLVFGCHAWSNQMFWILKPGSKSKMLYALSYDGFEKKKSWYHWF